MIQYLRIFVWMEKELKYVKNNWFINVSCASLTDGTYIVVRVLDSLNSGLFIFKKCKIFFHRKFIVYKIKDLPIMVPIGVVIH